MNWEKIKQNYPKAHDQWITFCQANYGTAPAKDASYILMVGSLFKFFDAQDIMVSVYFTSEYINIEVNDEFRVYFFCDISDKNDDRIFVSNKRHKTRKEAEEEVFTKAFEILENQ